MSGGGKVIACDSLTGLHLGFGLNVSADEYTSDVDVLGVAEYMEKVGNTQTWEFTSDMYAATKVDTKGKFLELTKREDEDKYEVKIGDYNVVVSSSMDNITITDSDNDNADKIENTKYFYDTQPPAWKYTDPSVMSKSIDIELSHVDGVDYVKLSNVPVITKPGHLTKRLIEAITLENDQLKRIGERYSYMGYDTNDFYGFDNNNDYHIKYPGLINSFVKYHSPLRTKHVYMDSSKRLSGKAVKCSGELKMSYYHNIMNNFVVGIDISGTITSSTRKSSKINALRGAIEGGVVNSTTTNIYDVSYYDNSGKLVKNNIDLSTFTKMSKFFKVIDDENEIKVIPARKYILESEVEGKKAKTSDFIGANDDYTVLENLQTDLSQYFQISNEKGGDVTFEKNKFNSRAAVVLGAQYKGWFAGLRGGISYNQGKVHAKDVTGTATEDVSFAAPFVGVHLMKNINMKGFEKGHVYLTADVNVENKQKLNLKGIKNFKQNSVNVSLGMTWKIK